MKILILSLLFLAGCTVTQTVAPLPPAPPVYKSSWPTPALQTAALAAIANQGAPLLAATPSDLTSWCPSTGCDKTQLYLELLSQLTKYESDYKATSTYTESFPDDAGKPQVSAGLLQLSIDDGKNYGCPLKTLADVEDPQKNLDCAVKILAKWVKADGVISSAASPWKGASRYWSQFRKPTVLAAMRAKTMAVFK